jgi:hypothetical protein
MKAKNSSSYWRRFAIGAGTSIAPFVVLSYFALEPGQYIGYSVAPALFGSLIGLGIDRLTHKRMPIWVFAILCLLLALVMRVVQAVGAGSQA